MFNNDAKRRKDYLTLLIMGWRELSENTKEDLAKEHPGLAFTFNILDSFEKENLL